MAAYIGPDGEVDAICLDVPFTPGGTPAKKGDWLVRDVDGLNRLCADVVFRGKYRQKFPKSSDAKPIELSTPSRCA